MNITSEHFKGKYSIEVDSYQYIPKALKVVQTGDNKGKEFWDNMGYFTTLGGAVKCILRENLITAESEITLKEYVDTMVNNTKTILKDLDI